MFNYFLNNKPFTPGDSSIAPLLSITHETQTAFDNPTADARGVFPNISKAFDKVWHDGLVFKLKSYGVEGEFLSLLKISKIVNKELL